jgi:hypothetical protein
MCFTHPDMRFRSRNQRDMIEVIVNRWTKNTLCEDYAQLKCPNQRTFCFDPH